MGTKKQITKDQKKQRKSIGERVEKFKSEVMELSRKNKMKIVPTIGKKYLGFDVECPWYMRIKKRKFMKQISEIGRKYGMTIVPIMGKYGPENEIQVLQDKNPNGKTN